jgi:endogenous inhibitor of DNA gyrase (YacG/DUF329 family)
MTKELIKCPFCDFEVDTLNGLLNHVRARHPLTQECPVCGKKFKMVRIHIANMRDPEHQKLTLFYCRAKTHKAKERKKKILKKVFEI